MHLTLKEDSIGKNNKTKKKYETVKIAAYTMPKVSS